MGGWEVNTRGSHVCFSVLYFPKFRKIYGLLILYRASFPTVTPWVTFGVLLLMVWIVKDKNTVDSLNVSTLQSSHVDYPKLRHVHRPPVPLWGQDNNDNEMTGSLSGIPILMMVTTEDHTIIRKSIESVLEETAGSGVHLVVSVSAPSSSLMALLQEYPIRIHTASTSVMDNSASGPGRFKSLLKKVVPRFTAVSGFSNILKVFSDSGVCSKDEVSTEIGILSTGANFTQASSYRITLAEIRQQERGTPYMEHPYNPVYRKAIVNSEEEKEEMKGEVKLSEGEDKKQYIKEDKTQNTKEEINGDKLNDDEDKTQNTNEDYNNGVRVCEKIQEMKEGLQFIKDSFPDLQYLVLIETGYVLTPDFVRFLNQTIHATRKDPSIYCISAHNPLTPPHTTQPPFNPVNKSEYSILDHTHLLRYDHFVATASLVPLRIVNEIIREFVVFEETAALKKEMSAMAWLEVWLSWWSRRRRRACIVPAVSRVYPISHTIKENDLLCSNCLNYTDTIFKTKRLLHHEYSQDLIKVVEAAQPLGTKVLNCSHPHFFPDVMNSSIYIIYFKMENYDDDFTFHHFMNCFGLDLQAAVGYFEGVFQLNFRNIRLLLMGIPYSPYSPSMKNTEALLVADLPDTYIRGQTSYQRFKHRHFNFSTVIVKQKIL